MADSGRLAAFQFGGVTYDADDCLQSWDMANAINDIVYQCNSLDKHAKGTQAVSFRVSLALPATGTTKINALTPGTQSTQFEAWPAGFTTNYIEYGLTTGKATVIRRDLSAPINGIIAADVEIALDTLNTTGA